MKIKVWGIIIAAFFAGIACTGTYTLADDEGQGDSVVDSVMDELQPPPGQNPNPSGPPDEYETETTPEGDVKKPPAPGKDGNPVKYTDEDGDKYWGTDGHLYPWPPPIKKRKDDLIYAGEAPGGVYVGFKGAKIIVREKTPEEIKAETEARMKKFKKHKRKVGRRDKKIKVKKAKGGGKSECN